MRVVNASEMRELDRRTIEEFGIPGIALMENAGRAAAIVAAEILGSPAGKRVVVVCGSGNNGGDGFVLARHLANRGANIECLLLSCWDEIRGDARTNLEALDRMQVGISEAPVPAGPYLLGKVRDADLVVDAILGTGARGAVRGSVAEAIVALNAAKRPVLALDIPSGICADTGAILGEAVRSSATVTFGLVKVGLLQYPGRGYAGDLSVVDIGIPSTIARPGIGHLLLPNPARMASLAPRRAADAHKGDMGRVFIIAGSKGLTGAAILAGAAATRTGSGLVYLGAPASLHVILEQCAIEPMTVPLTEGAEGGILGDEAVLEAVRKAHTMQAMALGPGLGRNPETIRFAQRVIEQRPVPMVLDADGLFAAAQNTSCLTESAVPLILTPHPGELSTLTGRTIDALQADRVGAARRAAKQFGAIVVLKGAATVIAGPDGSAYINPTGNPGMASGGMGDVLTGIITSLLGRGIRPLHAAVFGVYIHGLAGDMAAEDQGAQPGLIASELLRRIPTALVHAARGLPLSEGQQPREL